MQNIFCYGGSDDISTQTLLEYSRIFGRQKLVDSQIEVKRRFCKQDLNFMNRGKNNLTITSFSNLCTYVFFQPIAGPRSAIGRAPDSSVRGPGFDTRSGNILSFLLPLF